MESLNENETFVACSPLLCEDLRLVFHAISSRDPPAFFFMPPARVHSTCTPWGSSPASTSASMLLCELAHRLLYLGGHLFIHATRGEYHESQLGEAHFLLDVHARQSTGRCWRIAGEWHCLYRAIDGVGHTVDFLLSQTRDAEPARLFVCRAMQEIRHLSPNEIVSDGNPTYRGTAAGRLAAQALPSSVFALPE
jgi:hypothetical protein